IYAADPDDDWTDPDVWHKANPNYGISLKPEFLVAECERAKRSPRLENDFKRYHLNLWVEQVKRWFPMLQWAANTSAPGDLELWRKRPDELAGRRCFGGLDLGSTDDISSLVWAFPPESRGQRWALVCRFWVPELAVLERSKPRHPYDKWVREGALTPTPGNVT